MKIAGIDHSMNGPALCIGDSDNTRFEDCHVFYLYGTKKYTGDIFGDLNITGHHLVNNSSCELQGFDRYHLIADFFVDNMKKFGVTKVALEGYSMGSKNGLIFNIAENTAILKDTIYKAGMDLVIYAPTEIKKYATGRGRVKKGDHEKNEMYKAFLEKTGVDISKIVNWEKKNIDSPISDIVDCYYIMNKLADDINDTNRNK